MGIIEPLEATAEMVPGLFDGARFQREQTAEGGNVGLESHLAQALLAALQQDFCGEFVELPRPGRSIEQVLAD